MSGYAHAAALGASDPSNQALLFLLCDADRRRRNRSITRQINDTWHLTSDGIVRDGKASQ